MVLSNSQIQKRATAYSFLAHVRNNGTFIEGPLDVFAPIIKHALTELYPEGSVKGSCLFEITQKIEERFGLNIPTSVMFHIMRKIADNVNKISGKRDIQIFDDGSFVIEKFIFEDYKELIDNSKKEVAEVLKLFQGFCKIHNLGHSVKENDLISFIEQNRTEISYLLSHEPKGDCETQSIVVQFVATFCNASQIYETLQNLYLGSMLTSYLTYQPKEVNMGVELLLDTNFIVSLLDLNTPESTKTCSIFMETSKSLGYRFTVLKDTIEEFQALLSYKAQTLDQSIIAKSINKEDIYNACDRRKLTCSDLERISDNIEDTLRDDFGIYIIPNTDKLKSKAKFSREYKFFKEIRISDKSALHDAMAVLYVKEKRGDKAIYDFEKVNCWFVNNAISHNGENYSRIAIEGEHSAQPECIKVDNLLNIIWLSNPSVGIADKDFVEVGISSMVACAQTTMLPKARIIKELDDNIQKYRQEHNITDKDIVRLSTRITQRQITDIQSLNELAQKDAANFAARVKSEARQQEQLENERAQRFETLINEMRDGIEWIKQNKENLNQKNKERVEGLNKQEEDLKRRSKTLALKEQEASRQLHCAYEQENRRRSKKAEEWLSEQFQQKKRPWQYAMYITIIVIIIVVILLIGIPEHPTIKILRSNPFVTTIIGFIISGVVFKNYNDWCHNPNYEEKYKQSLKLPDELKELSYEEFKKGLN